MSSRSPSAGTPTRQIQQIQVQHRSSTPQHNYQQQHQHQQPNLQALDPSLIDHAVDPAFVPVIAIHGGASASAAANLDEYRIALHQVLSRGQQLLQEGATCVDIAAECTRLLEEITLFNAGRGAVFNCEGDHELDASVMRGEDLASGAVAATRTLRNPVLVAKALLEKGNTVLLAGAGADAFGERKKCCDIVPNHFFNTAKRRAQWEQLQNLAIAIDVASSDGDDDEGEEENNNNAGGGAAASSETRSSEKNSNFQINESDATTTTTTAHQRIEKPTLVATNTRQQQRETTNNNEPEHRYDIHLQQQQQQNQNPNPNENDLRELSATLLPPPLKRQDNNTADEGEEEQLLLLESHRDERGLHQHNLVSPNPRNNAARMAALRAASIRDPIVETQQDQQQDQQQQNPRGDGGATTSEYPPRRAAADAWWVSGGGDNGEQNNNNHRQQHHRQRQQSGSGATITMANDDNNNNNNNKNFNNNNPNISTGTVGCVVLDTHGHLASATSSGGLTNKPAGRVADSGVIGAGTYASDPFAAVSCAGSGEILIRVSAAYSVVARMRFGREPFFAACDQAIFEDVAGLGGVAGLVALDASGNVAMPFSSTAMPRGFVQVQGPPRVAILREPLRCLEEYME